MKKANKIAIIAIVILVSVAAIVYFYSRPNLGNEGSILVRGAVSNPENLTDNQIEALPSVTVQVNLSNSPSQSEVGIFNYTGVPLKVLLDQAHMSSKATSVFIQAPDGYAATLSIEEAQKSSTILAYQKDGKPMSPLSTGGEGPIRLVMGDQNAPHDWVKGVSLIEAR
jgi:DMSO/TMAO reductase YedYZ molybdopterin-dependent catalytic subunit